MSAFNIKFLNIGQISISIVFSNFYNYLILLLMQKNDCTCDFSNACKKNKSVQCCMRRSRWFEYLFFGLSLLSTKYISTLPTPHCGTDVMNKHAVQRLRQSISMNFFGSFACYLVAQC